MSASIRTVPEGYGTVTPWVIVQGAAEFLEYVRVAFGAEELARILNEDGTIGHAEVRIGDSIVLLFDSADGWPATPAFLRLYVDDGDAVLERAVSAGGTSVTAMTELFFGERAGRVRDPWGNLWWIHTRVAELDPDEMGRRAADPAYLEGMRYVQESLDAEMRSRTTDPRL